jgi:hypothetical protein
MNAPKETGALLHAPIKMLPRGHYHSVQALQVLLPRWQREARRLAFEYLLTGREIDRAAFERHMGGVLLRAREVVRQ